jgi:hypothetical protein
MKNRVYKIKDKILVQGNENELTKNEILVKEENDSVVLKERVNGEVKDIVVKGGASEPEHVDLGDISISQNEEKDSKLYSGIIPNEDFLSICNNINNIIDINIGGMLVTILKNVDLYSNASYIVSLAIMKQPVGNTYIEIPAFLQFVNADGQVKLFIFYGT